MELSPLYNIEFKVTTRRKMIYKINYNVFKKKKIELKR